MRKDRSNYFRVHKQLIQTAETDYNSVEYLYYMKDYGWGVHDMILILHNMKPEYLDRIRRETGEQVLQLADFEGADAKRVLAEAEIMIGFAPGLTRELLEDSLHLRWFHILSAGVERLEFEELRRRSVVVTNSSGIHGRQMAEQVLGMMLSFTRGLHKHWQHQQQSVWDQRIPVQELHGQTLTIVGAGRIGSEVARKAKAFDMRVLGVKRRPEPLEYFDEVLGLPALHDGLSAGDFILVLTPLTPDTFHLIGEAEFACIKPTAVFMNYGRGDVVDESAMIRALQSGQLAGLGLDVFHQEPLPADSPLWQLENVLMTPHTSGLSPTYTARALDLFLLNYRNYKAGEVMPTEVDLDRKY